MPRLDVRPDYPLLVRVLRYSDTLHRLSPVELGRLIDAASQARLRGWLLSKLESREGTLARPPWLADRLETLRGFVREDERAVRWEVDRLHRALSGDGLPWVLLKGAGYVAAGLPPGRGRRVADVDILVPYEQLAETERRLNANGWQVGELDSYDERYYREWMHELPPMVHEERRSVVDVHHAILPLTSRLRPDTARLMARALRVEGDVQVLCPSHMVLHAAAHLFHDGEVSGAIRDVADLDGLVRHFGESPAFWPDVITEARELGLTRPAYYALRYSARLMRTPIPEDIARTLSPWAPPRAVLMLMDSLVEGALTGASARTSGAAAFALYVRSHWLRMPPLMLARHLLRKSVKRE